jgi:transcriptional regulator with XRE-family HTH domain
MPAYKPGLQFDTARLAVEVRDAIRERGITQQQAAAEIGMTPGTLRWLMHQQQGPDTTTLVRVLHWLRGPESPLAPYETDDPERTSQRPRQRTSVRYSLPARDRVRARTLPVAQFQEPGGAT